MSDMGDDFRAMREERQRRNAERRASRLPEINQLRERGFSVFTFNDCQYRVNHRLDIYPTHSRWHDLKTGKRGSWRGSLVDFVVEFFAVGEKVA